MDRNNSLDSLRHDLLKIRSRLNEHEIPESEDSLQNLANSVRDEWALLERQIEDGLSDEKRIERDKRVIQRMREGLSTEKFELWMKIFHPTLDPLE